MNTAKAIRKINKIILQFIYYTTIRIRLKFLKIRQNFKPFKRNWSGVNRIEKLTISWVKTYSWSPTFPVYHIFVIHKKRSRPRCLRNQIYGNNFRREISDRRFIQLFWHNMTLLRWMPFLRVPIKLSLRFEPCLNAHKGR